MALSLDEALGMSLTDETDESIHVDIDTRQVTIPESQQVFGVESDEDVEVKHIVIDGRYNDGTDLSTFTFRVNYQNANGDKGTYLATELKVNDDSIEFDWVIGRQVVAYKGTIAFIVCAYTIDSSSVIQNEWNSTLGKGTTLEGLEVSEFDFGDDIVRQLASILSDVNAAQASAKASADEAYKSKTEVVALGKEQQAAIEKKGKDTLATIPEDYTQVSNDVSQLKEEIAKLDSRNPMLNILNIEDRTEGKAWGDNVNSTNNNVDFYACNQLFDVSEISTITLFNMYYGALYYYDTNGALLSDGYQFIQTNYIVKNVPSNAKFMRVSISKDYANKNMICIGEVPENTQYAAYNTGKDRVDIDDLKEDTAKLKDGKISKFYASSQGNTNLPDSDDGRIMDLKLYGKSEQKQYSGKNLFPPVTYSGNVSNLQIDAADGSVHLKGTPNDQVNSAIIGAWSASSPTIFTLPAGTYTLSGFGEWLSTPRLNLVYVENGELISLSGNKTVTFDKETNFIAVFVYANANAALDITFKPMIEKGSTATGWEPYVGGIPSPNPEYPQEIKSVVKPSVKVTSQNYLDYKDVGGGVTAPVTLAKGDHYLTRFFLTANEEINNGVEYLRDETWARINTLGSLENGKIVVSDSTFGWYSKHMKITCTENITIRVATTDTCAITLNDYGYLDKYVDYQAPQTATLPYTLNAIPVTSGGNVTIDGQQYIADYMDVERGKLVRMVKAKQLSGSIEMSPSAGGLGWVDIAIDNCDTSLNYLLADSYTFIRGSDDAWNSTTPCVSYSSIVSGTTSVRFYDTASTSVSTNVMYPLATPTETDLTADEIAAFKALASHYPVTNVSTTSDQLDGYTVFDYPISLANGWNYVKQQLGDTRDYLYGIDLMTAEAYVNSEYAAALAEIEV